MNLQFPLLDGIAPSWADISVDCSLATGPLFKMPDVKSLNTGGATEIGEQLSGGRLMNRGTGSVKHTSSMGMYASGWQQMLDNLINAAPMRGDEALFGLVHFDINVSYTPPGSVKIYRFTVLGARVMAYDANGAEGSDLNVVDVTLSPGKIIQYSSTGRKGVLG